MFWLGLERLTRRCRAGYFLVRCRGIVSYNSTACVCYALSVVLEKTDQDIQSKLAHILIHDYQSRFWMEGVVWLRSRQISEHSFPSISAIVAQHMDGSASRKNPQLPMARGLLLTFELACLEENCQDTAPLCPREELLEVHASTQEPPQNIAVSLSQAPEETREDSGSEGGSRRLSTGQLDLEPTPGLASDAETLHGGLNNSTSGAVSPTRSTVLRRGTTDAHHNSLLPQPLDSRHCSTSLQAVSTAGPRLEETQAETEPQESEQTYAVLSPGHAIYAALETTA